MNLLMYNNMCKYISKHCGSSKEVFGLRMSCEIELTLIIISLIVAACVITKLILDYKIKKIKYLKDKEFEQNILNNIESKNHFYNKKEDNNLKKCICYKVPNDKKIKKVKIFINSDEPKHGLNNQTINSGDNK